MMTTVPRHCQQMADATGPALNSHPGVRDAGEARARCVSTKMTAMRENTATEETGSEGTRHLLKFIERRNTKACLS